MCDCREQLLDEAKQYISYKFQELSLKKYILSYQDLQNLHEKVENLFKNLKSQLKDASKQFQVNTDYTKKINELLHSNLYSYQHEEEMTTEPLTEFKELADKLTLNFSHIRKSYSIIQDLRKSQDTQQSFEQQILSKLNDNEKLLAELKQQQNMLSKIRKDTQKDQLLIDQYKQSLIRVRREQLNEESSDS